MSRCQLMLRRLNPYQVLACNIHDNNLEVVPIMELMQTSSMPRYNISDINECRQCLGTTSHAYASLRMFTYLQIDWPQFGNVATGLPAYLVPCRRTSAGARCRRVWIIRVTDKGTHESG